MMFTRPMRVVFSLIHQTRVTWCVASSGTQSKLLTASKPSNILLVWGIPHYGTEMVTFLRFTAFSGPGTSGLSFTEGDAL